MGPALGASVLDTGPLGKFQELFLYSDVSKVLENLVVFQVPPILLMTHLQSGFDLQHFMEAAPVKYSVLLIQR